MQARTYVPHRSRHRRQRRQRRQRRRFRRRRRQFAKAAAVLCHPR